MTTFRSLVFACAFLLPGFAGATLAAAAAASTERGPIVGIEVQRGKGAAKGAPKEGRAGARTVAKAGARQGWTDREQCRLIVRQYYGGRALPPGLAKKGALPPGLRKQLNERGHLPPGLEKRLVRVPLALERQLPPLPPHHVRRFLGDDLLVLDIRTNLISLHVVGVFGDR